MAHKFDPANMNKLDNEWRRKNLPPAMVLENLGLTENDVVADIGCGIGYFSIPAAEIIKKTNKVFALDTQDVMIDEIEKRARAAGYNNIVAVKTDEYDLKLPNDIATFAILVTVLHEIDDKIRFLDEIKRVLKSKGKIAIVEWIKEDMEVGPPVNHRFSIEDTRSILLECGFDVTEEMEFAGAFYGVVATN